MEISKTSQLWWKHHETKQLKFLNQKALRFKM